MRSQILGGLGLELVLLGNQLGKNRQKKKYKNTSQINRQGPEFP